MLSNAVEATEFEKTLCGMVPKGTMVWIWTEKDDTLQMRVQIGVGAAAVSTGNSYNQKFDRIALAFIKIDKDQVLPKNARDNSTEVNTAAQNWVEVNGWDHDDPGHAIGAQFGGPGSLASGNIFPQDKVLNQATGASWEQRVGNLARRNKPQEDFQMCLLELFDYYDYKGSWDQRPADEEYFLLQEGTPRNPPPSMPAPYEFVPNPNNNVGNPTNTIR